MSPALRLALCTLTLTAACGNDEHTPVDAPVQIDAPIIDAAPTDADPDAVAVDAGLDAASTVVILPQCPGNPDLTISAATGAYVPMTAQIDVNDVVRFEPGAANHDMVSGTAGAPDGQFSTPLGQITCLRFTAAGTFPFHCGIHGFGGTLTVN